MISTLVDIASWVLILAGSFFVVVGGIGLMRMPDVFTRMHATSIIDTMGAALLILGMILQAGPTLVAVKLVFIFVLFFITSPVVTHALAQAALHERTRPLLSEDRREARAESSFREAAIESFINAALLTLLAVVTLSIMAQRSLFAVVILSGAYSFLMASVLIVLDAVDVAMTEASVGAGISTVVLLATLNLTKTTQTLPFRRRIAPLALALVVAGLIAWGTLSFPPFGSAESVIHSHVAASYLADSIPDTGVPNVVTSVLADYRGYDTLGETTVIFTAGIGVMLLLKGFRRRDNGRNGSSE